MKGVGALVPPNAVTTTGTPAPTPGGAVTRMDTGEELTMDAEVPPKVTVRLPRKFNPWIVTGYPPVTEPPPGVSPAMLGAAGVRVNVGKAVGVSVEVGFGVAVRVKVTVEVKLDVAVAVGEGVEVRVVVQVGEAVRVAVGVRVALKVGVKVAVREGVGVNVTVGVLLKVAVVVAVGVTVGAEETVNRKARSTSVSGDQVAPLSTEDTA